MENQHMITSYVPVMRCEKMAVTDIPFRQRALVEFFVKKGNSAGSPTSDVMVCMEMPVWVPVV
jgi:hypothetical protein